MTPKNTINATPPRMLQIHETINKRNELSKLIPGYTAPLRLTMLPGKTPGLCNASSTTTTMSDLHKKAMMEEIQQNNRSNATGRVLEAKCFKTGRMIGSTSSSRASVTALSQGWLGFRPTPNSEEVQADMALLRNRNYLDPKRFYKSSDVGKHKNMIQVGTVIEGAAEYCSSRLTKKEKRKNITEEILADASLSGYVQNKFRSMQQQKTAEYKKANKRRKTGKVRK